MIKADRQLFIIGFILYRLYKFFENDLFPDMELEKIIDDIRVYMHRTIKRLELSRETARKLYDYIKNTATTVNMSLQTKKQNSRIKKTEGIVRN